MKKAAKKAKKKAKKAVKTVKKVVKTVKKASEQTANIINKYGGIDKAMNSFKNKAQQFAQGVAKAGGAIAKITLDAVAYLETLFGCLGDLFEFIAIGYGKDMPSQNTVFCVLRAERAVQLLQYGVVQLLLPWDVGSCPQ